MNKELNENEFKQSKFDLLPDLNFNSNAELKSASNNSQVGGASYDGNTKSINSSLSSRVSLFEGFAKQNAIKKNRYALLSSEQDIKTMENEIMLQITKKFMQILYDEALLGVTKEQYEVSKLQVERTQKSVDAGKLALGNLLEIKSQSAREALNVTQQENNVLLAKLDLAQLLDLDDVTAFSYNFV